MEDSVKVLKSEQQRDINYNPYSYVTVSWLSSLLYQGYQRQVESKDLFKLPTQHRSETLENTLDKFWEEFNDGKQPSLALHLWNRFGWRIILILLLQIGSAGCDLLIPLLLQQILYYISPEYDRSQLWINNAVALPIVTCIVQILSTLLSQNAAQLAIHMQIDIRTVLITAIYKKIMVLTYKSSQEFTSGVILNTVNVDCEKVVGIWPLFGDFVIAPFQIGFAVYLLTTLIGASTYAGFGTLLAIMGLQFSLTPYLESLQSGFLAGGDKRLRLIREVLNGIRVVKFMSLENHFFQKISAIRQSQVYYLVRYYVLQAFYIAMYQITPISLPMVAFVVYGATNGNLDPSIIFPALTLFITLIRPVDVFPEAVTNIVLGYVSWKRVRALLLAEEESKSAGPIFDEADTLPQLNGSIFANAITKWGENFELHLNLQILQGQKVAVVGPVGCGKSSLLASLIGDMPKSSGSIQVNGSIAYCSQQPWILSDTIQGNILFGSKLNEDQLQRVLRVTDLVDDISQYDSGLLTVIGEKGVNLSGGQKARVALARALYRNADILLLDDVLSALDAQVGRQVFHDAILNSTSTVVMVTHQLHTLSKMDHIIVMDQGKIVEQGAFNSLMETGKRLPRLMKHWEPIQEDEFRERNFELVEAKRAFDFNSITIAEDKESGYLSVQVFKDYLIRAGGFFFVFMILVTVVVRASLDIITNVFLSWWTRNLLGWTMQNYMMVYGCLGISQYFFALLINVVFTIGAYKAATYYHPKALQKLLNAPIAFFDSQPIGRILNRFSKDIESVDQMVWIVLFVGLVASFNMISALIFLVYIDYRMIGVGLPLLISYYFILRFYQRSNIELKRFESVNKSPLYQCFSETLNGLSTVKAYADEPNFIKKQMDLINHSQQPIFLKQLAGVWITIRLRILASSLTLVMGLIGTLTGIDRTLVGLALTYAIGFIRSLGLLLFAASMLENEFNSVERLSYYCKSLPFEKASELGNDTAGGHWPSEGQVEFRGVHFQYPSRPDRTVLNNLNFHIKPGEKIGIVGRTGSGKSSIMAALFRLVELQSGSIIIDGLDISTIGLNTLRKSLQCIPQDPVLFSGTIRENLDLENQFSDERIWNILAQIGFKEYISDLPLQLDTKIEENGSPFSVGQRQLLCLGRALLAEPYVLIMDEATASLDHETDQKIQKCIKLYPNTVISIAHRLNTIIDFDRVLVLSDGIVVDYDIPHLLLSKKSLFSELCDATGPQNASLLRSIALEKYHSLGYK